MFMLNASIRIMIQNVQCVKKGQCLSKFTKFHIILKFSHSPFFASNHNLKPKEEFFRAYLKMPILQATLIRILAIN